MNRFNKDDIVLYLDNKAKIVAVNKKDWYYTIQILKDGRVFNSLPSQIVSFKEV